MYTTVINRAGWLVAGVLALFVVAAMTGVVRGGPLDPPGPPASTQKTLDQIAPVWSQVLAANDGPDACHSSRFLCVLGGVAVLDRETGLVWEQFPSTETQTNWFFARRECRRLTAGARSGWRIPSEEELASLLAGPMPGHPFAMALNTFYWTATTDPSASTIARALANGNLNGGNMLDISIAKTDATRLRWCVRGGAAYDGQ